MKNQLNGITRINLAAAAPGLEAFSVALGKLVASVMAIPADTSDKLRGLTMPLRQIQTIVNEGIQIDTFVDKVNKLQTVNIKEANTQLFDLAMALAQIQTNIGGLTELASSIRMLNQSANEKVSYEGIYNELKRFGSGLELTAISQEILALSMALRTLNQDAVKFYSLNSTVADLQTRMEGTVQTTEKLSQTMKTTTSSGSRLSSVLHSYKKGRGICNGWFQNTSFKLCVR